MSGYFLPNKQNFQNQEKFYQQISYGLTPDSFTSLDKQIINNNLNSRSITNNDRNQQNYYPNIQKFFTYNGSKSNQYENNNAQQILKNEVQSSRQQISYKQLQLLSNNKISVKNQSSTVISHKKLPRTQKKSEKNIKSQTKIEEQNERNANQILIAEDMQNHKKSNDSLSLQNIQIKSQSEENNIGIKQKNIQQKKNNDSYKNVAIKVQDFITFKDIETSKKKQLIKLPSNLNSALSFNQNQKNQFLAYQQRNMNSLNQKLSYQNYPQINKNQEIILEREPYIPPPPESISRFEIIPIQTRFVQMYQQVIEIPVQKVVHRYYTIQHKIQYIPKVTQTIQQYLVPQEKNIYHLQYVPVQKRIVHLPVDNDNETYIDKNNYKVKLNGNNFQNQNNLWNYDQSKQIYPLKPVSNVNYFQKYRQEGQRQSFIDTFVNEKPLPQLQLISQFQKPSQRQLNSNKFIPQSSFQKRILSPDTKTIKNNQFKEIINMSNDVNTRFNRFSNSNLNQNYLSSQNQFSRNGIISPSSSQKLLQKKTNFVTIQGEQYYKRVQQRKKLERQLFNLS